MVQNRNAAEKKDGSGSVIPAQYIVRRRFKAAKFHERYPATRPTDRVMWDFHPQKPLPWDDSIVKAISYDTIVQQHCRPSKRKQANNALDCNVQSLRTSGRVDECYCDF
ncbi:hypothetical protein EVAR_51191_1 [Eumeta japonica]|uniref:Uncharacterized protein n=1 Tax=Eumeta variegata TaxID=151549 RepID=A0A4C1XCB1_EUMVA|nr:hypothetical protein EVAR_51191_1 [Eumeta japonica]